LDPYKTNNSPYNFLVLRSMGWVKLQGKARDFTFLDTHGRKLHFSISIFLNGRILLLLSNSASSLSSFGLSICVCKTR